MVAPVILVGIEVYKVAVVVLVHVVEVLVDRVAGNVDILVTVVQVLTLADVVGHGFGEKAHAIEADALSTEVLTHGIGIGHGGIYAVDDAVDRLVDKQIV